MYWQMHGICYAYSTNIILPQDISGAGPTAARGTADGQPAGQADADSNGSGTSSADAMTAAAAAPSPA